MSEKVYLKQINELRVDLGLPTTRLANFQPARDAHWPILFGFREHVVPRPSDWRTGLGITGYWWPPSPASFAPPRELVNFLAARPPPVFAGFGSTATSKGAELSRTLVEAATRADVRLLLQSGWSRLEHADDDNVLPIGPVPYEWLFPKVSAVVHHAGAGTTGATLRAGVPSIPVPGITDQPYWSSPLVDLGVAPSFRRRRELDADWLSDTIPTAVNESSYRHRARELSAALQSENGCDTAVTLIERLLSEGVHTVPRRRGPMPSCSARKLAGNFDAGLSLILESPAVRCGRQ